MVTTPHTIKLKGNGVPKEGAAGASSAIYPGHLVFLGPAGTVLAHAAAGAVTGRAFAMENEVIGNGIDVVYPVGEQVLYTHMYPGSEVYAIVAAAAAAIVIGDLLESAGDGTLRKLTTGIALARALSAIDNHLGGTYARVQAEVL